MKIIESNGYKKIITEKPIKRGAVIFSLEGRLQSQASKYSIQIDAKLHLEPSESNHEWKFVNHSCDPNAFIDVEEKNIKALKDIKAGEEICFNYNSTEYEIAGPFRCHCGSVNCCGDVRGFNYLSEKDQKSLFNYAAPHIRTLAGKRILPQQK